MTDTAIEKGIKTLIGTQGVHATLDRLETLAKSRGMTIFARINFSQDASAVGMSLRPTQLLILGNPQGGTPLMVAAPSVALDLPLKVLAWQEDDGRCRLSYNTPEYLQQRHGFAPALMANIAGLAALVQAAAGAD
jgi:uncharacterized protein (DUF302 family)